MYLRPMTDVRLRYTDFERFCLGVSVSGHLPPLWMPSICVWKTMQEHEQIAHTAPVAF